MKKPNKILMITGDNAYIPVNAIKHLAGMDITLVATAEVESAKDVVLQEVKSELPNELINVKKAYSEK